jgi:hypothetical protein
MSRFDDEDERPEELTAWLAAGLRRTEALSWRRWNFTLDETLKWRTVGVSEALLAAQWQAAGVKPGKVGDWVDAEIGPGEAIRWHEFGFGLDEARGYAKNGESPDQVYQRRNLMSQMTPQITGRPGRAIQATAGIHQLLQAGVPHEVLRSYMEAQWYDTEAIAWAKQDIQAGDARLWQGLGLTSAEAGELRKADRTPVDVIQEWWRAGIPFDEVAEWIGAGLTAAEAVAQRASGVTVEQAAALRALRRGGAL